MNRYLEFHYNEQGHRIQATEWVVDGLECTRKLIEDVNEASGRAMWFEQQGAEMHLVLWPNGYLRFREYRLMNK